MYSPSQIKQANTTVANYVMPEVVTAISRECEFSRKHHCPLIGDEQKLDRFFAGVSDRKMRRKRNETIIVVVSFS